MFLITASCGNTVDNQRRFDMQLSTIKIRFFFIERQCIPTMLRTLVCSVLPMLFFWPKLGHPLIVPRPTESEKQSDAPNDCAAVYTKQNDIRKIRDSGMTGETYNSHRNDAVKSGKNDMNMYVVQMTA